MTNNPCPLCTHFEIKAGGGGSTILSVSFECELNLEPDPTEWDPIGCREFDPRPEVKEKLKIGMAIEDLIQSLDEEGST